MAKAKAITQTIGATAYSMPELREMALESRRKSQLRAKRLPAAVAVACDPKTGVTITMQDGCRVFVPLAEFHELRKATATQLRNVVLRIGGLSLEWPQLDMQFDIPEKLTDLFGMRYLMAESFGRTGGQAKSKAKAASSRANGQKGGRPRKAVTAS